MTTEDKKEPLPETLAVSKISHNFASGSLSAVNHAIRRRHFSLKGRAAILICGERIAVQKRAITFFVPGYSDTIVSLSKIASWFPLFPTCKLPRNKRKRLLKNPQFDLFCRMCYKASQAYTSRAKEEKTFAWLFVSLHSP
jgi:hypothetical protein